ncbi:MAG: hypothetical protein QXH30_03640 [Candidatus Bilamarchaeaceae archaeon]
MGRSLFINSAQLEHFGRAPTRPQTHFSAIGSRKLLDANRNPPSSAGARIACHISEKSHQFSPKCKGLFFTHDGKWKQDWMIKWLEWYKYVIAFTRKYFSSGSENGQLSSRAESAKTAWSG